MLPAPTHAQSGIFAIVDEPVLTSLNHPESIVHVRVHP